MITYAKLKHLKHKDFKKYHKEVETYHKSVNYFYDWSRQWEYPWILQNVPFTKEINVLDAGGGTCYFPDIVAPKVNSMTILDRDKDFIKTSKSFKHHFIQQDLSQPLQTTKQFDVVLCISVLEHIPEYIDAILRLMALVKPGGYLAMTLDLFLDNTRSCKKEDIDKIIEILTPDFELGEIDLSEDNLYQKTTLQKMKLDLPNLYSKNYKNRTSLGIIIKKI